MFQEEVVLKRCWLARYWGLAAKYGSMHCLHSLWRERILWWLVYSLLYDLIRQHTVMWTSLELLWGMLCLHSLWRERILWLLVYSLLYDLIRQHTVMWTSLELFWSMLCLHSLWRERILWLLVYSLLYDLVRQHSNVGKFRTLNKSL